MWAILEQMRDHATTIVGLVTALMLMYSWFRKPMKQLIAREQQQEEDLAILTWAFCRMRMTTIRGRAGVLRRKRTGAEYAQKLRGERAKSPVRKLRAGHSCSAGNAAGREAKQMTKQKAYVQFSKRIVLLVTIAVTAISLLAMVLCFFRSDTEALVSTVRTYINYATIVFAAYSGNSVFEKWLTQGKSVDAAGDTEEK